MISRAIKVYPITVDDTSAYVIDKSSPMPSDVSPYNILSLLPIQATLVEIISSLQPIQGKGKLIFSMYCPCYYVS